MGIDIDTLRDGDTIRTTADVAVLKPDRREKYNWKLRPTVKAGTKLTVRVEEHPIEVVEGKTVVRKTIDVRPLGARGGAARLWRENVESCDGELVVRLIEASEPAEQTAAEAAEECGWAAYHIVEALEKAGLVTAATLRAAIKAAEDEATEAEEG